MNFSKSRLALVGGALLILGACSQQAPVNTAPVANSTESPLPSSAAPVVTESPSPDASESPESTDEATPQRSPVPPVTGTRTLTLADAFDPGDWVEGSYTPTNQSPLQAIGVGVGCYSDELVEYRFSRATGSMTVSVAQDSQSDSSDVTLEWGLIVDGRQVKSTTNSFKETAELKTDLSGVAVVKISVKQKESGNCSGQATALITQIVVTA